MSVDFFELPEETQRSIIVGAEGHLEMPVSVVEKDIWLCWVLKQLFKLPIKMAFKGGTSLSKVFNLIKRFSEDVDITIDYRNFIDELVFDHISRSQLKKLSYQLKGQLKTYVNDTVLPFLQNRFVEDFPTKSFEIKVSADGEKLEFYYHTLLHSSEKYLRDHVLIEFGVRNNTEPSKRQGIETLLSQVLESPLTLPVATVDTLSPVRTFWEKATLVHVECHRGRLSESPGRLSRHWYDLVMLANSWVGKVALQDRAVLEDVVQHKTAFFNASYARYQDCLSGKLSLIPDQAGQQSLSADFKKMQAAGMFQGVVPVFEDLLSGLSVLENKINETVKTWSVKM